jgi:hypothetical protein
LFGNLFDPSWSNHSKTFLNQLFFPHPLFKDLMV